MNIFLTKLLMKYVLPLPLIVVATLEAVELISRTRLNQ
jgi:hypothetical protein